MHPPDPEMRNPAAANGRENFRKVNQQDGNYASGSIIARRSVYAGREFLGYVLETSDGSHQAVSPAGELIGSFRTRMEASRALSGVSA